MKIVCFTDRDDTKELKFHNKDHELIFIRSPDLPESNIYIVSLRKASKIYNKFVKFMRDRPDSKFIFLEEYKRGLTNNDFRIRDEPNTDIRMFSPEQSLKIIFNLQFPDLNNTLIYQQYSWRSHKFWSESQ